MRNVNRERQAVAAKGTGNPKNSGPFTVGRTIVYGGMRCRREEPITDLFKDDVRRLGSLWGGRVVAKSARALLGVLVLCVSWAWRHGRREGLSSGALIPGKGKPGQSAGTLDEGASARILRIDQDRAAYQPHERKSLPGLAEKAHPRLISRISRPPWSWQKVWGSAGAWGVRGPTATKSQWGENPAEPRPLRRTRGTESGK